MCIRKFFNAEIFPNYNIVCVAPDDIRISLPLEQVYVHVHRVGVGVQAGNPILNLWGDVGATPTTSP